MNLNEVYEKIQKLLRLSESSNPNEAAVAASKAASLMLQYQIDQASVESFGLEKKEIVQKFIFEEAEGKNKNNFKGCLASEVASFFSCKILTQGSGLLFIGRKSDMDATKYLYKAIINQIEDLTNRHWITEGYQTGIHGKSWKNSFRMGALNTVTMMLRQQKQSQMKEFSNSGNSRALAVYNELGLDIASILNGMRIKQTTVPIKTNAGYHSGTQAGKSVNIGNNSALSGSMGNLPQGYNLPYKGK